MTDRELLELAAKAAGLTKYSEWSDKIKDYDSPHYCSPALHKPGIGGAANSWNPLTDDGDALRLAVACRMEVYHGDPSSGRSWVAAQTADLHGVEEFDTEDQRLKATRRIIVRAAAEIGRVIQ